MNKIRLAVSGAGFIGKRHIATIAQCEHAELLAIADPATSTQALAEQYQARLYSDLETLLSQQKPDGVVIATPTELHEQGTLIALQAGAHVLLEKPIAPTLAEAERIIAAAAASGRHVLVGHHRRYYALTDKTRELVQNGALGQLIGVSGQWTSLKNTAYFQPDWRKKRESGPVLINLIHEIDSLRTICGELSSVMALANSNTRGFAKEDTVAIILNFANGALGTFLLSDTTPSPWTFEFATGENSAFPRQHQNAYRFMGSDAALEYPNLKLWRYPSAGRDWHHAMQAEEILLPLEDAFACQCQHFCEVIAGRAEPRITARDASRTLAATLAVLEAADSGQQIDL